MTSYSRLQPEQFVGLGERIIRGLGISKYARFVAQRIECAWRVEILRKSPEGLFQTNELWVVILARSRGKFTKDIVKAIANAAQAASVENALIVLFQELSPDDGRELRDVLLSSGISPVILQGYLAELFAADVGSGQKQGSRKGNFSFLRARTSACKALEGTAERETYQTASFQPTRVIPLHGGATLAEADLFRVVAGGSCLLLGDPGAGKTTSLRVFAAMLAEQGPRTPVYVPLSNYRGDLLSLLGESITSIGNFLNRKMAEDLLQSGSLVILLDGINEVQDVEVHRHLVQQINALTDPAKPLSASRWIVSGRIHDYESSVNRLMHLEARRWEIQPLTDDLIFQYLRSALGEADGRVTFDALNPGMRELCGNPLLLSMIARVRIKTGNLPTGRGAIYRRFVEVMAGWGEERGLGSKDRETLASLLGISKLTQTRYQEILGRALTALARSMVWGTMIPFSDAKSTLAQEFEQAQEPKKVAAILLNALTTGGLLRQDYSNRLKFFHHTVQEYFQAMHLQHRSAEELIPDHGLSHAQREAVLFVGGMIDNPKALIRRAAAVDLTLAADLIRDASRVEFDESVEEIARKLWKEAMSPGRVVGGRRRWARRFAQLSDAVGLSIEELARKLLPKQTEMQFVDTIVNFYAELGDHERARQLIEKTSAGSDMPFELLFSAAINASYSGDDEKAVSIYTEYIDIVREKNHSDGSVALGNRANSYKKLGRTDLALADYHASLELQDCPNVRVNLATTLRQLGSVEEARGHLHAALELDPSFGHAYHELAILLAKEDLQVSLQHSMRAVELAAHEGDLILFLPQLVDSQEKLELHSEAFQSYRRMLALNPTSNNVKRWRERIVFHRRELDEKDRQRSARERLIERDDMPLPTLVESWLRAARYDVQHISDICFGAVAPSGTEVIPVALMPGAEASGRTLQQALDDLPTKFRTARRVMVVVAAEDLSTGLLQMWMVLQEQRPLALVTALEVRDALVQGDQECQRLFTDAFNRTGRVSIDPFEYKGVVRQQTEFFGRSEDTKRLTEMLARGQQIGLYGIHKIGKSSLLEQIRRRLRVAHPEISTISVELNASYREVGDLYREVMQRLPGASPTTVNPDAEMFRKALQDFHKRSLVSRPNHRLLIILDEYAYLIPDRSGKGGIKNFLEALGLLKALHQEGWLTLLPCGRTAALSRAGSWEDHGENPFIDLLHAHFLEPLPKAENDDLMRALAARAGLPVLDDGLEAIYEATGGHPGFSRTLGSRLLKQSREPVDRKRVTEAVEALLEDRDQSSTILAIYEERMDPDEQQVAATLALLGPKPVKDFFSADLRTRRKMRDAIDNLVSTTVLLKRGDILDHRYGLLRDAIRLQEESLGM
ncbi:MAG: hypothetical protein K1Y02_23760 [Candidatus Hydrogenedentes bacterium]|nr:hypothetical protein [Candidatus Hydrogenedentota bacterium]